MSASRLPHELPGGLEREGELDAGRLRAALAAANLPSLLPVLYQLTGERSWLAEEMRPAPTRGIEEDDSGGYDAERQERVREAVVAATLAWAGGAEPAVPRPSVEEMAELMSTCLGEPVAPEYGPMVARHLGLDGYAPGEPVKAAEREFSVLIVGAGISGIAAAIALQRLGIAFTVLERHADVGGTWFENDYPGARVDIPTSLYSFSFWPQAWSRYFAPQDEVHGYVRGLVESFGLGERIYLEHEVEAAEWDGDESRWRLRARRGDGSRIELTANALITAAGLHNRPNIPDFPGLGDFEGDVFHSTQWPPGASLAGKRVGVVGSGATSMQVVTAIAEEVESLTVFQRSAHWMVPNSRYFEPFPEEQSWLFDHVPFYRQWYRFRQHWLYAERIYPALVVDPEWDRSRNSVNAYSEANRKFQTAYLRQQLEGREDLIEKCTPKFPPFGKRLLIDNGWFAALRKPGVELVTEEIERFTRDGILTTDGATHELDTVVLCTGFQQQRFLSTIDVVGAGGRSLEDEWEGDEGRAYLGMTAPGFPNLFFLYGPNTNPPGGSWITVAEDQVRYVAELLATMVREGYRSVEVRRERFEQYNRDLDAAAERLVTSLHGVDSYYRNSRGRVVTNSPWTILEYFSLIERPDLEDFTVTGSNGVPAADRGPDQVASATEAG